MHMAARPAKSLATLAVLTGCEGNVGSPAGPSGFTGPSPTPPPAPPSPSEISGTIVVRSIAPEPGTTLTVRNCTISGSGYHWLCADQLRVAFDVQVDQDISNAVVTAEFIAAGAGCGTASSRAALTAGTQTTVSLQGVAVSTEDGSLRCPLPPDTTRVRVQLWRAAAPATPLLTREFTYDDRFVMP